MNETKLEQEISSLREVAKQDPNVDIAKLMLNALDKQKTNTVPAKTKYWLYLLSAGLPPLGFVFALYYYFKEEDDAKTVSLVCASLTAVALILFWATAKMFTNSPASSTLNQIQQITPQQIQESVQ